VASLWFTTPAFAQNLGPAKIISFDAPGSTGTFAYSINSTLTVTGIYMGATPGDHGFVRSALGAFTSFDVPGSGSTVALSINGGGAVTGF
jgi:hypothetical protein